jgi:hypothetical protein
MPSKASTNLTIASPHHNDRRRGGFHDGGKTMKSEFLVTAVVSSPAFNVAMRALDGKPLNESAWIAMWDRDADALCRHLRPVCGGAVVACALGTDWSYVL